MARVAPGMQKANRQRFNLFHLNQLPCGGHQRGFIQRQQNLALHIQPFRHFQAQMARHQRGRCFQEQIVQIVADFAPDLDGIAKPIGGEQAHLAAGAFNDGIRHQRRAMHNAVQITRLQAGFFQKPRNAGDNRFRWIIRRGQPLASRHQIPRGIVQDKIREGAANINTNARCRLHGFAP